MQIQLNLHCYLRVPTGKLKTQVRCMLARGGNTRYGRRVLFHDVIKDFHAILLILSESSQSVNVRLIAL